jgi:ribonuclease HI
VEIYTDGACRGNPGPGGWAALAGRGQGAQGSLGSRGRDHQQPHGTHGRDRRLGALKRRCAVKLYTDSKYVLQGITEWLPNWKARGWRTAAREPVKNQDLVGAARCGRLGTGHRVALGQGPFRPRRQ